MTLHSKCRVQSYEKSSAIQNKNIYFYCRDGVTSRFFRKVRKNEIRTKQSHYFFYADCTVACSSLACFIMTLIRCDLCGCRALFVQSCGVISTGSLHTLCRGFAHFVQMPCTLCANVLHSLCNASALFLRSSAFENTPCSTFHKGLVSETNETGITYQTLQIIEIIF